MRTSCTRGRVACCRAILSGTPVRKEFQDADKKAARKSLHIRKHEQLLTVLGGSSGSKEISEAMASIIPHLLEMFPHLHIHHQRGLHTKPPLCVTGSACRRYRETSFFNHMGQQLAASDLVISRSGAMACAEIMATGVPSILWPLASAADNHQLKNAEAMAQTGASLVISESSGTQHSCAEQMCTCLIGVLSRNGAQVNCTTKDSGMINASKIIVSEIMKSLDQSVLQHSCRP